MINDPLAHISSWRLWVRVYGVFHQAAPGVVELAELAHFCRAHVSVAGDGG